MSNPIVTNTKTQIKKSQKGAVTPADTVNVIREMINAKKEYEITREVETSKRLEIESNLRKHIATLTLKRDQFITVLDKEYSMRKYSIDRMFDLLDKAYEDGNMDVVIQSLDSIEGIVKTSPLKEILQIGKIFESDDELVI